MQYWNSLLHAVVDKKNRTHFLDEVSESLSDGHDQFGVKAEKEIKKPRDIRWYYLGETYPNVYLTKREAECMFWIVQEYTISETAYQIDLSPRTVEFYVKNMKLKLNCANKKQLVRKVLQTTLLQQLEKEGMCIVKH